MTTTEQDALPVTPEFVKVIRMAMRDPEAWERRLAPDQVRRTEAGLVVLLRSLDNQIKVHGQPDEYGFDPNWLHRTKRLRAFVVERLAEAQAILRTRMVERADHERAVEALTLYKEFAWELAVELSRCGERGAERLRDIESPSPGHNALDWLNLVLTLAEQDRQHQEEAS